MPNARTKLLIVDDDAGLRASLMAIFLAGGKDVRSAEDGFSALTAMRREVPDILLSDLNMPGMSGYELLSVVRRRFPRVWVIAMSSAFAGAGVPAGIAADTYYEKGTSLGGLLEMVGAMSNPGKMRAQRAGDALLPIWIPSNGNNAAGKAYITIHCPECLRTFPQVLEEGSEEIHEAVCIYCKTRVHYAIVKRFGAGPAIVRLDGKAKRLGGDHLRAV
jgi:CheY-like chemotaxis protein